MALLLAVKVTPDEIWNESNNYTFFIDILEIPRQKPKDLEQSVIPVLGIKVNTNIFTFRILRNKLHEECHLVIAELNKQSRTFLKIKLLTEFLCFCAKKIRLGGVFI